MKDDVFSKLRIHLNNFILGAPESDSILEILRNRYASEEAEIALILGQRPQSLSTLAKSSNKKEEVLFSILEKMADKGLVYKQKSLEGASEGLYSLLPTAVGLWETSFAKGERNSKTEHLANHWLEYYKSAWGKHMHSAKTPFNRVIPVEKSIPSGTEIYSYERASELIKEKDYVCVVHCACREAAELNGEGCGKPTEVCLHFGDLARFFVERGYAKEISKKEALEILDITEKAGLIHMVGNSKEMGVAMCSCCTCCCTQFRAIAEMPKPDAVARSRFMAEVDTDRCTSCETCKERCLVNAVSFVEEVARVDAERCLGCGLCVTACPVEAISLKERQSYQGPVEKGIQLAKAFIQEKNQ